LSQKIKRILSVLALTIIILYSIVTVTNLLELKESDNRYAAYFHAKTDIDVLLLGSSHVRYGFFPMELWGDYGITSYNLAADGNTIPMAYWSLVNALDYQTPQLVVMDVFDMYPGRSFSEVWGHVHMAVDAVPLSINKFKMVMDLFSAPDAADGNGTPVSNKKWELLWTMGEYHTRWNSLSEDDFDTASQLDDNSRVWKGAIPLIGVVERQPYEYVIPKEQITYDALAEEYLLKVIQLCEEKEIELLLINTGYDCNDEAKLFADSASVIAGQYGIDYIDFTTDNIINFDTDLFTNGHNTHVNFSGAERFTSYLGNILATSYHLADHRNDSAYESWQNDYLAFVNNKEASLLSQTDLTDFLMCLNDTDYQLVFEIPDASVLSEKSFENMLKNLGIDVEQIYNGINLITVDMLNADISYLQNNHESGVTWDTSVGPISIYYGDGDIYGLYLDVNELYTVSPDDSCKMRVTVLRASDSQIIDIRYFY